MLSVGFELINLSKFRKFYLKLLKQLEKQLYV